MAWQYDRASCCYRDERGYILPAAVLCNLGSFEVVEGTIASHGPAALLDGSFGPQFSEVACRRTKRLVDQVLGGLMAHA